jgi:protein-disulfide isomerase
MHYLVRFFLIAFAGSFPCSVRGAENVAQSKKVAIPSHPLSFDHNVHPTLGSKRAQRVIILFADPYCEFCHQSISEIEKYTQRPRNVKIIIHNYPIHGGDSYNAVRALLVAHQDGLYSTYRRILEKRTASNIQPLRVKELIKIAESLGLDDKQFQKQMFSDQTSQVVRSTLTLVKIYKIEATPSFVIIDRQGGKLKKFEGLTPLHAVCKALPPYQPLMQDQP